MRGKTKGASSFIAVKLKDLKKVIPADEMVIISSIWAKYKKIKGTPVGKWSANDYRRKKDKPPPTTIFTEDEIILTDIHPSEIENPQGKHI